MKTTSRNYSTVFATLFFALTLSVVTMANDKAGNPDKKTSGNDKVELRFIGNLEEHPVYQLNLNGDEEEEYVISFRETDGTVVYSNIVKGNFSQRFLLKAEDIAGNNSLRMEIKSRKSSKSRVYIIRRTENVVQENVIVKLQ